MPLDEPVLKKKPKNQQAKKKSHQDILSPVVKTHSWSEKAAIFSAQQCMSESGIKRKINWWPDVVAGVLEARDISWLNT